MTEYTWLAAAYAAVGILVVGLGVRIYLIARLPMHLRWELAPVPHERAKQGHGGSCFEETDFWTRPRERSRVGETIYMLKEIFLLHTVRKHNGRIWPFTLAFHSGIYCLVFMAFFLLAAALLNALGYGAAAALLEWPSRVLGGLAYLLGTVGVLGMLGLRIFSRALRSFSGLAAYLNLAVLLALFASGGAGMLSGSGFMDDMREFFNAALLVRPGLAPGMPAAVHLGAGLFFIALLPFTSMVHFAAKFFTFHSVLWDDRAMDASMELKVKALLCQHVGWSSAHLGADGKKNWIDVVKGE